MDWKKTLGSIAPVLGTALGSPLAGTAIKLISNALLGKDGTEDEVSKAIESGLTPEQIVSLKSIDNDFKLKMRELDVKLEELAYGDTSNARDREIKTGDSLTPRLLAIFVTIGFFSELAFLSIYGKPTNGGDALMIMLGSLGAAWTGIIAYYYGSSAGSKQKTDSMAAVISKA